MFTIILIVLGVLLLVAGAVVVHLFLQNRNLRDFNDELVDDYARLYEKYSAALEAGHYHASISSARGAEIRRMDEQLALAELERDAAYSNIKMLLKQSPGDYDDVLVEILETGAIEYRFTNTKINNKGLVAAQNRNKIAALKQVQSNPS